MSSEQEDMTDPTAVLTEIWREVLKNPEADETSDLFDLGGTSIHVLEIVGKVYDTLGVDLRLRQVFEHKTPRSLALLIGSLPGSGE